MKNLLLVLVCLLLVHCIGLEYRFRKLSDFTLTVTKAQIRINDGQIKINDGQIRANKSFNTSLREVIEYINEKIEVCMIEKTIKTKRRNDGK